MEYHEHVSEPWFTLIKLRIKTIEGRLANGNFKNINLGDYIIFINNDFGFQRIQKCQISKITEYQTFHDYLQTETLEKCLPGIDNIEQGLQVYYKYYTKEQEQNSKVIAMTLE